MPSTAMHHEVRGAAARGARRLLAETRTIVRTRCCPAPVRVEPEVTVSLTSYPGRLSSLRLPLLSLLQQTVRPGKLLLVLAEDEFPQRNLPPWLTPMLDQGLELLWVPRNIRQYQKLLPVMARDPEQTIVTADDDTIYPPDWLEGLLDAAAVSPDTILGYRGAEIALDVDGTVKRYTEWPRANIESSSSRVFLTGVGGILYPPRSLAPVATDASSALRVCPTADDIWFWAAAVLNGSEKRVIVPPRPDFPQARRSQANGTLVRINVGERENDRQFRAVLDHFELWGAL